MPGNVFDFAKRRKIDLLRKEVNKDNYNSFKDKWGHSILYELVCYIAHEGVLASSFDEELIHLFKCGAQMTELTSLTNSTTHAVPTLEHVQYISLTHQPQVEAANSTISSSDHSIGHHEVLTVGCVGSAHS